MALATRKKNRANNDLQSGLYRQHGQIQAGVLYSGDNHGDSDLVRVDYCGAMDQEKAVKGAAGNDLETTGRDRFVNKQYGRQRRARRGNSGPDITHEVLTLNQDYNQDRALLRKRDACDRVSTVEDKGGNLIISLDTCTFELLRTEILDCVHIPKTGSSRQLMYTQVTDKKGMTVQDTIQAKSWNALGRLAGGNHGPCNVTLNLYRTSSRIMVNGSGYERLKGPMQKLVERTRSNGAVRKANNQIKMRIAGVRNDTGLKKSRHKQQLENDTLDQPGGLLHRSDSGPDPNRSEACNDLPESEDEHENAICPICDVGVSADGVFCETCDSWLHYKCLGLSRAQTVYFEENNTPYTCHSCMASIEASQNKDAIPHEEHDMGGGDSQLALEPPGSCTSGPGNSTAKTPMHAKIDRRKEVWEPWGSGSGTRGQTQCRPGTSFTPSHSPKMITCSQAQRDDKVSCSSPKTTVCNPAQRGNGTSHLPLEMTTLNEIRPVVSPVVSPVMTSSQVAIYSGKPPPPMVCSSQLYAPRPALTQTAMHSSLRAAAVSSTINVTPSQASAHWPQLPDGGPQAAIQHLPAITTPLQNPQLTHCREQDIVNGRPSSNSSSNSRKTAAEGRQPLIRGKDKNRKETRGHITSVSATAGEDDSPDPDDEVVRIENELRKMRAKERQLKQREKTIEMREDEIHNITQQTTFLKATVNKLELKINDLEQQNRELKLRLLASEDQRNDTRAAMGQAVNQGNQNSVTSDLIMTTLLTLLTSIIDQRHQARPSETHETPSRYSNARDRWYDHRRTAGQTQRWGRPITNRWIDHRRTAGQTQRWERPITPPRDTNGWEREATAGDQNRRHFEVYEYNHGHSHLSHRNSTNSMGKGTEKSVTKVPERNSYIFIDLTQEEEEDSSKDALRGIQNPSAPEASIRGNENTRSEDMKPAGNTTSKDQKATFKIPPPPSPQASNIVKHAEAREAESEEERKPQEEVIQEVADSIRQHSPRRPNEDENTYAEAGKGSPTHTPPFLGHTKPPKAPDKSRSRH